MKLDLTDMPVATQEKPLGVTKLDLSDMPKADTTLQDNYKDVVNNKINPDHAARVFEIARNSDFGPAMIAADTDTAEKAASMPDFVALSGSHPATAQFLISKEQMAIAHDDIENLKRTEKVIEAHNMIQSFEGGLQGSSGGLILRDRLPSIQTPETAPFQQKFAAGLGGIVGDLPAMTIAAPGGPAASFAAPALIRTALMEHYQNGDIKTTSELMKRIYSVGKETLKASIIGKAMGLGGGLGLKALEGPIGEAIGPAAMGKGVQGLAKLTGELSGMTVGGAAVEGKVPTGEDIALNVALVGALHASGVMGGKLLDIRREHITAENSKAFIEHLAETSQESKLRGRDEQSHGKFIDSQVGPALVPVEAFNTLFQSKGIDPSQAAKELGVSESHTEAVTSGGNVAIPMGIMQSKVMDAYRPGLANDVKFGADSFTPNEIQERVKEYHQTIKDISAESDKLTAENPAIKAAHDQIYDDFKQALTVAGEQAKGTKKSVEQSAKIAAASFITEANKRGLDPIQFYNEKKPQIFGGGTPEGLLQSAWHGTPHDFDKFSLHAIGTGEGAQAYGWGLYFAGDKAVAEYYKRILSPVKYEVDGKEYKAEYHTHEKDIFDAYNKGGKDAALARIDERINELTGDGVYSINEAKKKGALDFIKIREKFLDKVKELKTGISTGKIKQIKTGRLYEVDVPGSETLIDWDRPLSEQPAKVKEALIKATEKINSEVDRKRILENPTMASGAFIYHDLEIDMGGAKAASEYLNTFGIKGIRYADANTRGNDNFTVILSTKKGEYARSNFGSLSSAKTYSESKKAQGFITEVKENGSRNYVIFDENAVEIIKKHYQGGDEPLASYSKTKQGAVIKMFKGADASSFMHEMSHFWLDDIHEFVKSGKADESYLKDWKIIQDYVGHATGKELTTEQHEKFAQSFEKYLLEGKAPSVELQGAFAKLKAWMMKIYESGKRTLGIEITPEIRGVFDRMLATDKAIEEARAEIGQTEAIPGLEGEALKARQMAEAMLLKPMMDEMSKANQEKMATERIRVTGETETKLKADPVYGAIDDIIQDKHKLGEKITGQMVRNEADKYILGELSEEKAALYDVYAEANGLSSGDELLKKIASSDIRETALQKMVDDGMKPFEAMNDPALLKDNALKALHEGDGLGRLMALEAQVLDGMKMNKDVNAGLSAERRVQASRDWEQVKALASETLGNKNIKDAGKFRTYYTLERKAAEKVAKATVKNDYEAASKAKREQMVSHALAAEAIRLKARIERNTKYLEEMQGADKTSFKDIRHFLQVGSILDRFGLKRADFKQADRTETLAQWSSELSGLPGGMSPLKDWILNEAINKPFNSLTANELKDVKDTVAHIRLKANEELSVELGGKRALVSALAGEMSTAQVESGNIGHTANTSGSKDWVDKIISGKDWVRNELINVETLLNKLGGYKYKGIWWKAIFEGSMRSLDNRAEMGFEASAKQAEIWGKYSKKELSDMYSKRIFVPEFGVSITKAEIMMMGMNWGNSMNRQRLIEGSGKYKDSNGVSWTEQSIKSVLDRELDKRDWDTVQANLDHVNSFWPLIAEKYRKLYGFEPEKVTAEPIQTKYGEYPGGYFPLRKDTRLAIKGMEELKAEQTLGDMPMHIAYTKNGFTKERTIGAVYPVSLDIRGISKHMTDVIHDLNLREWVMDTSKILNNKEVQTSIQDGLGQEGYFLIKDWVKGISGTKGYESWDSVLREMRRRTVIANLGFRIKSAALQMDDVFTYGSVDPSNYGVTNVITEVASHYTKLITRQESLHDIVDRVYSKSKYMKYERGEYIDRDLDARAMRIFGQDTRMGEVSMALMQAMDHMISMPAWEGAYKTGLRLFDGKESEAVDYADNAIRTAQASSRVSEMAKVMTDGEFKKAFTMFYSFASKKASMIYAATDKTKTLKQVPQLVGTYAALLIWPSVLAAFIHDYWPSDDTKKKKWLKQLLTSPAQLAPVIRDVADLVADKVLGLPSFGYQATPLTGGIEAIGNAAGKVVSDNATGMQKAEAVAGILPYAVPYPKQANDWLFNVADYANGNMEPELQDITKRRPIRER